MFSKAIKTSLEVALDSSILGHASLYNKAVNPNDIFQQIATQTMFKTVPGGALLGGVGGVSTAAFENVKGSGNADYMQYGLSGAALGAGVGTLLGTPMLYRTAKNLVKDVGLSQNGRTLGDDILSM